MRLALTARRVFHGVSASIAAGRSHTAYIKQLGACYVWSAVWRGGLWRGVSYDRVCQRLIFGPAAIRLVVPCRAILYRTVPYRKVLYHTVALCIVPHTAQHIVRHISHCRRHYTAQPYHTVLYALFAFIAIAFIRHALHTQYTTHCGRYAFNPKW